MALLELNHLHTFFTTKRGIVKAVNDVSYSVEAGKTLGVVGESGSGKSVSAMSILQLLDGNGYIDSGTITFDGRDLSKLSKHEMEKIRGNEISVIFQEPMTSLNPVFTVEKQVSEPFMIHQGMSKKEAAAHVIEMLKDVKIPNPETVAKQYPHQLSGGMRQRVMIAMALACQPKLLIADEPTTALDVTIQAQVLELMRELRDKHDMALLMITHDLGIIAEMCDYVEIMYAGRIVESGTLEDIFDYTRHPYTQGLFNSLPNIDNRTSELKPIRGLMPDPANLPEGCSFWPRCDYCMEICKTEDPHRNYLSDTHFVECHLYDDGGTESKL